jgi:hypothetical protein
MKRIKLLLSISIILASSAVKAQDSISFSLREVYNYQVGDVFHLKVYKPMIQYIKREVVGKVLNNPNEVTFNYRDSIFVPNSALQRWELKEVITKEVPIYDLDSIISYPLDSVFVTYEGRDYLSSSCGKVLGLCDSVGISYTEIITPFNPEGYRNVIYFRGLGAYEKVWYSEGGGYSTELLYYKKNGVECGDRIKVGIGNLHIEPIDLYPNPANTTIQLQGIPQKSTYTITNQLGESVSQGIYNQEIDISNLPQGVYVVQVQSDGTLYYAKFMKH